MTQQLIDQLLAWAAKALGEDVVAGREEYFGRTGGDVHEGDRSFEPRMQGFFAWYLFDRRTAGDPVALAPAQRFLLERGHLLSGPERELISGGLRSRLSLYTYLRRRSASGPGLVGQVRVRDELTGRSYDVAELKRLIGIDEGDLFEARLIPASGQFLFSTSFLFHDKQVHGTILREIRRRRRMKTQADPASFCWEVSKMALQADRFKNVAIDAIYNFEKPFLAHKRQRLEAGAEHRAGGEQRPGAEHRE